VVAVTTSGVACEHCGIEHTRRFVRVFGDNDGRLHRCPACDTTRRLRNGSAAGKRLAVPDPQRERSRRDHVEVVLPVGEVGD
jgi:uncharacterized Zn finger protein